MIDYILDNMAVNHRKIYRLARLAREKGFAEYTICEEIAHEQRLAAEDYRVMIKKDSKSLGEVNDFGLLSQLVNEMVDDGTLDLDEGGGDVMIVYEFLSNQSPNLFISERIIVSDDGGVHKACKRHGIKYILSTEYGDRLKTLLATVES